MGILKTPHLKRKFKAMDAYRIDNDDLPDGAFFAKAEEQHGWTADDWAWFAQVDARKKLAVRA